MLDGTIIVLSGVTYYLYDEDSLCQDFHFCMLQKLKRTNGKVTVLTRGNPEIATKRSCPFFKSTAH